MKFKALVFITVVCALFFCGCTEEKKEEKTLELNHFGSVYNYVDPETGVNYLIFKDTYKGGITVRYNADGSIMVTDKESTDEVD